MTERPTHTGGYAGVGNDTDTYEQFLQLHVGLGFDVVFVCLFQLSTVCGFGVSLDHFIPALLVFAVLNLVSSVPRPDIGQDERPRNDLF